MNAPAEAFRFQALAKEIAIYGMWSVQSRYPDSRVRAVAKDGRLIDLLG